jgi:hypothetical protein
METHDQSGVDLTLIRSFLSMTPSERLDYLDDFVGFVTSVWERNGIRPIPDSSAYAR